MNDEKVEKELTSVTTDDLCSLLVKSGMFPDVKTQAQAYVKVLAGQELGLKPIESMQMLYIVGNRIGAYATLIASKIKQSKKYDYFVEVHTKTECAISFFSILDDTKIEVGKVKLTLEDAKKITDFKTGKPITDKDNWRNYPENMLFARCISNGMRFFCPDVMSGSGVMHSVEELSDAGLNSQSSTVIVETLNSKKMEQTGTKRMREE